MSSPASFMPASPLGDALVILGAAGIVIPVFARFRITPVIGFILVGLLVGPFGLARLTFDYPWLAYVTISAPETLEPFAEFGIVLLLFSVGLELSFERLWAMRRQVLGVGAAQLVAAALLLAFGLAAMGEAPHGAVGIGVALAMSSTALVLPIAGAHTKVGRSALAMLLFEDLALVPIIFLLGAFSPGNHAHGWGPLLHTAWLGLMVVLAMLVAGRFLLRPLFAQAARTKSPELFLSASLLVVIVAALATAGVGLSPIVGALTAGLLIAETEYHTEVEGLLAPFKGLALGVFLITIGMSIDLEMVWRHASEILLATALVVVVKTAVTALLLRATGAGAGHATEAGILLASPSESTLIVLTAAAGAGLIQPGTAQFWQIVTALGLTVTPLLAGLGRFLARRIERRTTSAPTHDDEVPPVHTLIIGMGRVGQLVADMLAGHGKPYLALDANPDLVAGARAKGYHAVFGDATSMATLDRLGLAQASAVVLTMDDAVLAQRLVKKLRAAYPALPVLARARDTTHAATLYRAGASLAVPEALEASLQLSEAVLAELGVPMGFIIAAIHEKRDDLRVRLMEEGGLTEKPRLKTTRLRDRAAPQP